MKESLSQESKHYENPRMKNPSKRNSLKKWFRRAVSRCDVDDSFCKEDTILIEEGDALVFIPILSEVEDGLYATNRELSPSLFDQSTRRKNHRHRQKVRDFKLLLKMKMHLFKNVEANENWRISTGTQNSVAQDNAADGNSKSEVLDCYDIFNTQSEHLDILFDYMMKNSLKSTQPKEMQPFQYLTCGTDNSLLEPTAFSPLERWDTDEEINPMCTDPGRNAKIGNSNIDREQDEEEDCRTLLTEKSFEQPPPFYSTSELNSGENRATSSGDATSDSSCSTEQDTQNTLCSSENSDINSSSDSGDSNTVIYTIPTFKQKRGQLNVSGIVRSFKDGTLTEKKLTRMAKRSSSGITFRNQKFYDQPPSSADEDDEEHSKEGEQEEPNILLETDDGNKTRKTDGLRLSANNSGGVKFDSYSRILVYRGAKRNVESQRFSCPSLKSLNFKNSLMPTKVDKPVSAFKSILKKTDNEREAEEIAKATHCDKVNVKSFLAYFEYFENQKHSEEASLGKFREEQLSHYYSKDFFPELLEGIKSKRSFNSEYRKSKMATEVNIGRKIGDGNEEHTHCLDNIVEVPKGSVNFK